MTIKHGDTRGDGFRTSEYSTWIGMRQRCNNPNDASYPRYGGRGIFICERWNLYTNFLQDMGRKPSPLHSIDRINNDDGYYPENSRWADQKTQSRNRSDNNLITAFNKTQCITDWASATALHPSAISTRLKYNWSIEDAVSIPNTTADKNEPLQLTINGETKTAYAWAKTAELCYGTVKRRIAAGLTDNDVINTPVGKIKVGRKGAFLTLNNETKSVNDWVKYLGINKTTLCARVKAGWRDSDIVSTPINGRDLSGSNNIRSKLSLLQREEILNKSRLGCSSRNLAIEYNVTKSCILHVRKMNKQS
jgi:hypothetical protein